MRSSNFLLLVIARIAILNTFISFRNTYKLGSSMSSLLIQRVAKLALQTFSPSKFKEPHLTDNFTKLVSLVHQIRKQDVSLAPELTDSQQTTTRFLLRKKKKSSNNEAPVSYIEVYECEVFTLGIFVLKQDARIPLHDHPNMYGIIKVIHGTVNVQNYSRMNIGGSTSLKAEKQMAAFSEDDPIPVIKHQAMMVNEESEPCYLKPDEANFHEIRAIGGSAAFLDILAPPYRYPIRECHFYREISLDGALSDSNPDDKNISSSTAQAYLILDGQPDDYWTDSHPYMGPKIEL